jgi:hypothetical protein
VPLAEDAAVTCGYGDRAARSGEEYGDEATESELLLKMTALIFIKYPCPNPLLS